MVDAESIADLSSHVDVPRGGVKSTLAMSDAQRAAVAHALSAPEDARTILHVSASAGEDEIRRAYRRACILLHPDKNPSEKAPVAFKRVQDAWDALSSPYSRAEYDADVDNGGSASGAAAEEGAHSRVGALVCTEAIRRAAAVQLARYALHPPPE